MSNRKLLVLVFLALAVFVGLAAYGDFNDVGSRLVSIQIYHLLGAVALAALNYLLRFTRWSYYLNLLKIDVPFRLSLLVFFSGLALSVTPGKVGELFKGHFLRSRAGVPLADSIPAILMERLTDVISVVLVGMVGLALLPVSIRWVLLVVFALCGVLVWFLASRHSEILLRLPVLRQWRGEVERSEAGLRTLTTPKPMLVSVAIGMVSWLSEGLALWLILQGLGADLSVVWALPVYASATIVGAVSTLPGGLVGTEGTMLALLQQGGIPRDAAAAATLLVRLVTLWFAVALGLVALGALNRCQLVSPEKA